MIPNQLKKIFPKNLQLSVFFRGKVEGPQMDHLKAGIEFWAGETS